MRDVALQFLTGVLGTEGARALARQAEREPDLAAVLVPRTALAWLQDLDKHEGNLPGVDTSYLKFSKNGVGYGGVVNLGDINYEFQNAGQEHLAAAIAVAVGQGGTTTPAVRDLILARLGKSIDALAKAQVLVKALPRVLKADLPGTTAKPREQTEPEGPTQPQKQARNARPKLPKSPKLPGIKVEKSEAATPCAVCERNMFNEALKFEGCMCWQDLAKHVTTTVYNDGVVLEFKPSYPAGAWSPLRKALKGGQ